MSGVVVGWRRRRGVAVGTLAAFVMGLAPMAVGQQGLPGEKAGQGQSALKIDHDPLSCVNTELAPQVDASVAPAPVFEKGYVYFKAAGTEDFYYAPMKGVPDLLAGVLPRPLPETRAIDYYVRARDTEALTSRTKDYVPPVVVGNACKAKGMVVGRQGAGLTIGLTREGQEPIPRGFNRKDIAYVILASGAVVGIAAALKGGTTTSSTSTSTSGKSNSSSSASTGAGLSTGVIVVGGVIVAGAAVAIAASQNHSNNATATFTPTATSTPQPTATRTFTPTIPPLKFVQAEVSWSGVGDIDLQILNGSNQSVGQTFPAGCESTSDRTERVLLQGTALVNGSYRVVLTGKTCPSGTNPSSISAVVVVQTESGPKCSATFVAVPVPGTLNGCSFTIP